MEAAASFAVLRAAQRAAVPWKNGGGVTREVAVYPPGSDFTSFDWRVSIAEIASPGPFSVFADIDRRMVVLSGRLTLSIDGAAPLILTAESPPLAFAGDVAAFAEPHGGPVVDLNVMTRRGRCTADLKRLELRSPARLESAPGATRLLVALTGQRLVCAGSPQPLERLDALLIAPGTPAVTLAAQGPAALLLAEITPA
ncbi:MAG TPA: HutD family protein [Steroidobacteraceae bacterium]|nr:HutD family protein [Steroidobacteraceae bacterium]